MRPDRAVPSRPQHLQGVAFRILGSLDDAQDAVQQTWLKASGADLREVQSLTGWLTTVTARQCLDVLRARQRRHEVSLPDDEAASAPQSVEDEVLLAESVGRALLVVMDRLSPSARVALVLHDMFSVPFEEVGAIVDRSSVAAKKLASRTRQKVQCDPTHPRARLGHQRQLAAAFLSASRAGDVNGLLAVLAPDVIRQAGPSWPKRSSSVGARHRPSWHSSTATSASSSPPAVDCCLPLSSATTTGASANTASSPARPNSTSCRSPCSTISPQANRGC